MDYQRLRTIARWFRILGFIAILTLVLFLFNGLTTGILGFGEVLPGLGILAVLDAALKMGGTALAFFAASELIPLFIDMAYNTRRAAERVTRDDYPS